MTQPAPAPRFSRASKSKPTTPHKEGSDTLNILEEFGFSDNDIENLRNKRALS
jgi:crotonobetainyl-CoA:carnitine CoA-transferase CaiB-like acyl-CoA transferase